MKPPAASCKKLLEVTAQNKKEQKLTASQIKEIDFGLKTVPV